MSYIDEDKELVDYIEEVLSKVCEMMLLDDVVYVEEDLCLFCI